MMRLDVLDAIWDELERHRIPFGSRDQPPDQWLSRIDGTGTIKPDLRFVFLMV